MPNEYYYKATLEKGESGYDPKFVYRLGLNIHPSPDKKSTDACGVGIHLAKTLETARMNVRGAQEFYLARAGVILGEDNSKIRCAYCWIDRKLEPSEILTKEQLENIWRGIPSSPLCGRDWVQKHATDFTQADFDKLTLTVKSGKREVTVKSKLSKKELRAILSTV